MEKKLLCVLFILLAVSSFCFADSFEIGASGNVLVVDKDVSYGAGLNIAKTWYFNKTIGIGIYCNLLYPINSGRDSFSLDFNAMLGPVFKVFNNGTFSLPIAVGFYADRPFIFDDLGSGKVNIGAGANITAEIGGKSAYFYTRVQGAYGFLNGGEIVITPSIGVGFGER